MASPFWHNRIILGVTRTGKTTDEIRELQAEKGVIRFFINSKNENCWDSHCAFNNVTKRRKVDPLDTIEWAYENEERFKNAGIINLRATDILDPYTELANCIDKIFEKHFEDNLKQTVLFIDEIYEFQSKRGLGKTIRRCFGQGLGIGLNMTIAAHRATQVHNDLMASAEIKKSHLLTWDDLDTHVCKFMRFKEYVAAQDWEWSPKVIDLLYPLTPLDRKAEVPVSHRSYIQNGSSEKIEVYRFKKR